MSCGSKNAHGRIFSVCHNKIMVILDPVSGKILSSVDIGAGVDAAAFDPLTGFIFSSNGEGTLTVAKETVRKDGLKIKKVRTPIGVIACIFESRPNVIVDVAALCVKSGNAVIIRGGKEAIHSNTILCSLIGEALQKALSSGICR